MSFQVTPADARANSPLLTQTFPLANPPDDPDAMQSLLDASGALVGSLTCRAIGPGDPPGEAVPDYLESLAMRAVLLKAEQMQVRTGSIRSRRSGVSAGNLRGFQAGPYSESYFGPEEAMKAKMLDSDASIHEVLWALATEDCRAAWLALWNDEPIPAAAPQAFEWSSRPGGYEYGGWGW